MSAEARPKWQGAAMRAAEGLMVPAVAVLLALGVGAALIAMIGPNPLHAYGGMFRSCFGDAYGFGQILHKTTSLVFTGLAVAFAFRAGLFNIGAEGQLYFGAFLAAIAAVQFAGLPGPILLPLCILISMAGAAAWALVPGFLKAKFGAHEVITTIMMNLISAGLVGWTLVQYFAEHATTHTKEIPPGTAIPSLGKFWTAAAGTSANLSVLLALVAPVAAWFILMRTRLGFEIRAVGLNPQAAETAGISVPKITMLAMAISGAFAGLVGVNEIFGYQGYFERDFSGGVGFLGIAVALMARNNPFGVILAALLFSTISYGSGGLQEFKVPRQLGDIMSAIVIIFVIAGVKIAERAAVARRKRKAA